MTGRVFTDSANIYQDQAKILFDYYKKAAEKIVVEEKDLEAKIDSCQKEIELNESEEKFYSIKDLICSKKDEAQESLDALNENLQNLQQELYYF